MKEPPVIPDEKPIRKPRKPRKKQLDITSILEDTEDADQSDIDTYSEEEEIISSHKPTRSGRMPKVPRKFDVNNEMVVEKIVRKSKDEIEPGSIMIVTEDGPNGEPVYKIFMITQDNKKTPVELKQGNDTEIHLKTGISAKNILTISATHTDDEEIEEISEPPLENNMTIPADETITSLKSISVPTTENGRTAIKVENESSNKTVEDKEGTIAKMDNLEKGDGDFDNIDYIHRKFFKF